MFHADEIHTVVTEQTTMTERCSSVGSYLENMGVCGECLRVVAIGWTQHNMPMFLEDLPTEGTAEDLATAMYALLNDVASTAFARGYTAGLIMGRGDM